MNDRWRAVRGGQRHHAEFVHGLSGRHLKLEQGDAAYTDSETLFLPAVIARMQTAEDNFTLCKAMVALLWAQTRFGTFRADLAAALNTYADSDTALKLFHALETLRLEACIARELPGLYREMQRLKAEPGESSRLTGKLCQPNWRNRSHACNDSLRLLATPIAGLQCRPLLSGRVAPGEVRSLHAARIEREKICCGSSWRIERAGEAQPSEARSRKPQFDVNSRRSGQTMRCRTWKSRWTMRRSRRPRTCSQLLTSIYLDLGEIPPEYLVAAGPRRIRPHPV